MSLYKKNGITFEYEIIYKKIKNVYLRVKNKQVIITANKYLKEETVNQLLDKYANYLLNKIDKQKTIMNYLEDLEIMFFGQTYQLKCEKAFVDNVFIENNVMYCYYKKTITKTLDDFYLKSLNKKILEMQFYIEEKTELSPSKITIKKLKSKWGSCNYQTKVIIINLALAFLDPKYLEYVLFHEFCHLRFPNHSNLYYAFLKQNYPDYKSIRLELKKYSLG